MNSLFKANCPGRECQPPAVSHFSELGTSRPHSRTAAAIPHPSPLVLHRCCKQQPSRFSSCEAVGWRAACKRQLLCEFLQRVFGCWVSTSHKDDSWKNLFFLSLGTDIPKGPLELKRESQKQSWVLAFGFSGFGASLNAPRGRGHCSI